ncbi:KTSC domain-containing protein [Thalassobacillus pellis]|uniref:KTSC domain-containing protein n=1 Tax=Thalassobacillus pellis TaxID=748008 RepID=UPI001960C538|nr:hypothetical protein [Thalassobacillus pellis]
MRYTKFDSAVWNNQSFEHVGYDKTAKRLCIIFMNNLTACFEGVEESTIFHFILSTEKESFLNEVLLANYECRLFTSSNLETTVTQ